MWFNHTAPHEFAQFKQRYGGPDSSATTTATATATTTTAAATADTTIATDSASSTSSTEPELDLLADDPHPSATGDGGDVWPGLSEDDSRAVVADAAVAELNALTRRTSNRHTLRPIENQAKTKTKTSSTAAAVSETTSGNTMSPLLSASPSSSSDPVAETQPRALRIVMFLFVAKDSQAKILVGASGNTLKYVTERAQRDLEVWRRRFNDARMWC
jgi:hypothetical protein